MFKTPTFSNDSWNYKVLSILVFLFWGCGPNQHSEGSSDNMLSEPLLYRKISIPSEFCQTQDSLIYGGDIRIGDLNNNKKADFLVYRAARGDKNGATKPCFIGAFDENGEALWQVGAGGIQPYRPGPVAIHDIDNDGFSEIICFFSSAQTDPDPFSMKGIEIQIRDGKTGALERSAIPPEFAQYEGSGPNWVHQRIFIANFSGSLVPQHFIVKLGKYLLAVNDRLQVVWTYFNPNDEYQNCPAYIPAIGDIDSDGKDEVMGGYYLLDDDGSVMWEKKLGKNMDAVAITAWDEGNMRAFGSGFGHILDEKGSILLALGEELVPHGQEMQIADFTKDHPGPEMVIRWNGHKTDAMLVANDGEIIEKYQLNESPNNTGMTAIHWENNEHPALLFNGGVLWYGWGEKFANLPGLHPVQGDQKMGWYHCIPANVCGDFREEVITYNPWDRYVFIYTQQDAADQQYQGYHATARQYNVRLMD
jgi:hypothetical protein